MVSDAVSAEDTVVCVIVDSAASCVMTANPENVSLSGCAGRSKMSGSPDILVAAMASGTLFEGVNCAPALSMIENWANAAELRFTAGLGVGGGPVLALHGPYAGFRHWRSLGRAMSQFAENAAGNGSPGFIFCSPNMRRRTMLLRLSRIFRRKWRAI